MKGEPDVSVIIVSYDSGDELLACLESIEAHSDDLDVEVVVIETSARADSLDAAKVRFPSIITQLAKGNIGYTGGNNLGIQLTRGKYILFLNPDTLVGEGAINRLRDVARSNADCGAVGPRVLNRDKSVQPSCSRAPTLLRVIASTLLLDRLPLAAVRTRYTEGDLHKLVRVDTVSGCCMLVPRAVLDSVGGFDEAFWMYCEEDDLCARMRHADYSVYFEPGASIIHFGGAQTSDFSMAWRLHVEKNRRRLFRKHHGVLSFCAYRVVVVLDSVRRVATRALRAVLRRDARAFGQLRIEVAVLLWRVGARSDPEFPGSTDE